MQICLASAHRVCFGIQFHRGPVLAVVAYKAVGHANGLHFGQFADMVAKSIERAEHRGGIGRSRCTREVSHKSRHQMLLFEIARSTADVGVVTHDDAVVDKVEAEDCDECYFYEQPAVLLAVCPKRFECHVAYYLF